MNVLNTSYSDEEQLDWTYQLNFLYMKSICIFPACLMTRINKN